MPTKKSYITGYILSLGFTLLAFSLVMKGIVAGNNLIFILLALAIIQLCIQLVFFLHLGRGSVWNTMLFLSTISLILVVVLGSLWIMAHLNHNMSPEQMNDYIQKSENIFD